MHKFLSLGAPTQLVERLDTLDFNTPTPIQADALPLAFSNNDILGSAQTGTCKTMAPGELSHSSKALQHKHKQTAHVNVTEYLDL